MVARAMTSFIGRVEKDEKIADLDQDLKEFTDEFMKPLIAAMELEGSYEMKKPCYDKTLVDRDSPICL